MVPGRDESYNRCMGVAAEEKVRLRSYLLLRRHRSIIIELWGEPHGKGKPDTI